MPVSSNICSGVSAVSDVVLVEARRPRARWGEPGAWVSGVCTLPSEEKAEERHCVST